MREEKKEYYLKEGRLDLSSLEYGEQESDLNIQLSKGQEGTIRIPNIYKDAQIEDILKEMGDYFSNI